MYSKQIILSAVWMLSHLLGATTSTVLSWEDAISIDYKSFNALAGTERFWGPDGLYTWTNTSDFVYIDANPGGNFSIEYPEEYAKFLDRAIAVDHPGFNFLPGAKAGRSAGVTCGNFCGAASPGGTSGVNCVACVCSTWQQICTYEFCETTFACQ